jgi:hypothetical protein
MDSYLAKPQITIDPVDVEELRLLGEGTTRGFFPEVLDAGIVERLDRLGQSEGEDLFGNLAVLFLADPAAVIVALRQALDVGDAAAVIRRAHALSGAEGGRNRVEQPSPYAAAVGS